VGPEEGEKTVSADMLATWAYQPLITSYAEGYKSYTLFYLGGGIQRALCISLEILNGIGRCLIRHKACLNESTNDVFRGL
jgi:hypothetical protein